ncbi:MAG TPA: radical SAM protein [Methanofastidiosum sp.]|nr:radical SAM protein [Methanofastidiosum sp.]HPA49117.1 radical SAM protein [Methanofastidiosum sp.]HQK62742.1 radical SAM protein [Methanofastidiosum sp.]HQM95185.1 radical SAM protein [Methanofastidiosum sp.]HQQ48905.1 radical SAM protein [Methanofastidiosum sp.]
MSEKVIDKTKSICPVCYKVINADIVEEKGKVLIKKTCSEHGDYQDIYWSDYNMYINAKKYHQNGPKLDNPHTEVKAGCPYDCGLCSDHLTPTVLCNIDVTNRCNMRCPICFANAQTAGYVLEPTKEELIEMMKVVRNERPVPGMVLQFAGGEPTIRDDLPDIVEEAKKLGFTLVQVATNGVRLARDLEYCKQLRQKGLNTVYLQFDGVTEKPYIAARGFNALPIKIQAMDNFRKASLTSVVLVPTLVKGVNDDQVNDIIRFGIDNIDIVRGVNFQPVSFAGRIEKDELEKMRITIPDFVKLVEEQTGGEILAEDFYAPPSVNAFSSFIEAWRKTPQVRFTCHEHCGVATYVFVDDKGKITPITRFIDVDGFLGLLDQLTEKVEGGGKITKTLAIAKITKELPHLINMKNKPKNLDIKKLLLGVLKDGNVDALADFSYHTMLIGCMHFQDPYNFDVERVKRCAIHYAVPGGKVIPFCTYNSLHREKIEKKYAVPLEVWQKQHREQNIQKHRNLKSLSFPSKE